jgi:hypothetical protein
VLSTKRVQGLSPCKSKKYAEHTIKEAVSKGKNHREDAKTLKYLLLIPNSLRLGVLAVNEKKHPFETASSVR